MKEYRNQNLYGQLSLQLLTNNSSSGAIDNLDVLDSSYLILNGINPILRGLSSDTTNKILFIIFNGSGILTIKDRAVSSLSQNRIITKSSRDILLYPNEGILLIYNPQLNMWNTVQKETEILVLPSLQMSGAISQTAGFNNLSDGRINLSSTVPLTVSLNHFFDCSVSSFLRIQGGSNINLTLTNMSEGQTVKVVFESTGVPYSINWAPYIRWGSSFFAGGSNTLFPGDIPTPSSYLGAFDLYEITNIGGQLLGRASLDHL
jgi:hypothetical protein